MSREERSLLAAASSLALALVAGCGGGAPAPACAQGESIACTCAGGAAGHQTCDSTGAFFSACSCPGPCDLPGAVCSVMPDLHGHDLDFAGAAIADAGLRLPDPVDPLGYVTVQRVNDPPVEVLGQAPPAGSKVPVGTRVVLTVTLPPDQATLGLPNSNFLVGNQTWQDTEATAQAYYDLLDPPPLAAKATLAGWKAAVGFGAPADAEASAIYVTHTDLGFGRHMHMRRQGSRVATYVENYPTVEDTIAGTRLIATVAMEWAPGPYPNSPAFTQFYTFNKKGQRIEDPALDDHGHKLQPAVCLACHGGVATAASYQKCTSPPSAQNPCGGWLGARFIPFDLDAESFADRPGYRREDQEAAFKTFNEIVAFTWRDDARFRGANSADPDPVPLLIDGWYGGPGHPRATQAPGFVPPGWSTSTEAKTLYLSVYSRSCQTCHAQRSDPKTNFSSYEKLRLARDSQKNLVHQRVFENGSMPLSQRGYLNFWLSYPSQPKALAAWLGEALPGTGKPVARPMVSSCDPTAGPPCEVATARPLQTLWLDGRDSQYNDQWSWRQTGGPAVALLPGAGAPVVSFVTPAAAADLRFELVVALAGQQSAGVQAAVVSQSPPSAPLHLAVAPGVFKAVASWDPPASDGLAALTSYAVLVQPGALTFTAGAAARQLTLTGLQPGASYTAVITASNAVGSSQASAPVPFTLPTVPGQPALSAVQPGDGSATVSWLAPPSGGSPITGYTLLASSGGAALVLQAAASASSALFPGLTNGVAWSFTVFASNAVGDGQASNPITATPAGLPGAPAGLTATRGNGSVLLRWSAPADTGAVPLTGYRLTGAPGPQATEVAADATQLNVTGLANGTPYAFELVAHNALFEGPAATAGPVTPATLPGAPGSASAAAFDATSAMVSWTAPASDGGTPVRSYLVVVSPGGAQVTALASATSVKVSGLTTDSLYTFAVAASNDVGLGPSTSSGAVMPDANPGVPSAPALTAVVAAADKPQASLAWSAPIAPGAGPVTSYRLTATETASGAIVTSATGSAALTGTLSGLTGGLFYRFTVAATNFVGTGPASAPSAPAQVRGPPQPPAFTGAVPSDGRLTLSWTAPLNLGFGSLNAFTLSWPQAPAGSQTTSANSASVTGLAPGASYHFSLVANGQFGDSAPATLDAVFAVAPGAPASATASSLDSSALVRWTAPLDSGGLPVLDYTVSWTTPPAGAVVCPAAGSALCPGGNSTTITGLTNGSAYVFTVKARTLAATSATGTATNAVVPTATPGRPSAPSLAVITPGVETVTLNWTAPVDPGSSPITGYLLTAQVPGGGQVVKPLADPAATSGTITLADGLTGGVSYQFSVTAQNTSGPGSPSSQSALTLIVGRPQPPTGVAVQRVNDGSFKLSWTPPGNTGGVALNAAGGYLVSWTPSAPTQPLQVAGSATSTNVSSAAFAVGTAYTLTVAAANQYNPSAPAAAPPLSSAKAPAAPIAVIATPQTGLGVGVTWTLPSGTAATGGLALGPSVVTLTSAAPPTNITHAAVAGTSDSFTGLTSGAFYAVTVQATNTEGSGTFGTSAGAASNTVMAFTPAGAPSAPQAVSVQSTASQQATLAWSAPAYPGTSAITSHRITATPTSAGATVVVDTGSSSSPGTISGLLGGLSYTFTVQAQDGAGRGPASAPTAAQAIVGPPQPPTGVTVQQQNGAFLVSWTAPVNTGGVPLTSFDITSSVAVTTTPATLTGASTSASVSSASFVVNQPYVVSVAARNVNGPSSAVAGPSTTFGTAPGQPTVVAVVPTPSGTPGNTVSGSYTVTWSAPAANGNNLSGYLIAATPVAAGAGNTASAGPASTSATVTGLTNCASYTVKVTATNGLGSTPSAAFLPASPPAGPPAQMGVPSATPQASQILVGWTAPANNGCAIDQFAVDSLAKGAGAPATTFVSSAASSQLFTGLSACPWNATTPASSVDCVAATWSSWQYSVRAHNAGGWSTTSAATGATRPLVSFGGDNVFGVFSTAFAPPSTTNCAGCHAAALGNRLVFAVPISNAYDNIVAASTVSLPFGDCIDYPVHSAVTPANVAAAFLLTCPTQTGCNTGLTSAGGCVSSAVAHPGGLLFSVGTTPYHLLYQWMLDGSNR